jgi:hypothetical protein
VNAQRKIAMIAEMIHSASLIHDDVIDQSFSRRGKPSVNVLWNHKKVSKYFLLIKIEISSTIFISPPPYEINLNHLVIEINFIH